MKRIFIIIGSLGLGGTEKQLLMKIDYLKKRYNFTVIIFYRKGELYNSFKKLGIKIIDLTAPGKVKIYAYLSAFFKVFNLIKKHKPEIINLYLPHSYIIFGILSYIFSKVKFVMSRRSLNNYQKKIPFIKFFEKFILHKKMKFIMANNKAIVNELINHEGVEKKKVKLIYNSVTLRKIKRSNKKEIRILLLANLIPYKNHSLIIRACNEIRSLPNFRVDLVGGGHLLYKNQIDKEIKRYNLEKKIHFLGPIHDYIDITNHVDIGVLTSDEEGLSNSILEYMSIGIPVIATNVGGNSEMIDHNKNGFLVKKNDHINFAKYLKILITNRKLRIKFGNCGHQKIKQSFNVKKNMEKYYKFYKTI